jgi:hypothetical protein
MACVGAASLLGMRDVSMAAPDLVGDSARFSSLKFPEADLSGQSLRFMRLKHMRARDNLRPLRWRKVLSSRLQVVRHLPFALIISLALTFLPSRSFAQG